MAVDPSIALGGSQAQAQPSPMGALGSMMPLLNVARVAAETQNLQNQAQNFAQTFAARQRLGQIVAGSPDLETGLTKAFQDPLVSGFGGQAGSELRQMMNTMATMQGQFATQNRDAMQALIKGTAGALADPSQFGPMLKAQFAGMPPEVQKRVLPQIKAFQDAMLDGMDLGSKDSGVLGQNLKTFQKRLAGALYGAGLTSDAIQGMVGKPLMQDLGSGFAGGLQDPFSGAFLPTSFAPKGLSPQIHDLPGPLGQPRPAIVGGGNPLGGGTVGPVSGPGPRVGNVPGAPGAGGGAGSPAGGTKFLAEGPTTQQKEAFQKKGELEANMEDQYNRDAQAILPLKNKLDLLSQAMTIAQAGGGAETRNRLAQVGQLLHNIGIDFVTPEIVNKIGNGDLAASQVLANQIKSFVTKQVSQDVQGQGRAFAIEAKGEMDSLGESTDPAAILAAVNKARLGLQQRYAEADGFHDFKAKLAAGDPSVKGWEPVEYPRWFLRNYNQANLPATNAAGMDLGPTPAEGIKGATSPIAGGGTKVTHKFVPGKGLVPVEGAQ